MHLTETQINDFADDVLANTEREQAALHLQECAACRAELAAVTSLLQRMSSLPASIEPERDLRPQVWSHIDRSTLWNWRYPLAAAAIVLIAVTSVITTLIVRDRGDGVVRFGEVTQPVAIDLVSLERRYGAEVDELQRLLDRNRDDLAPETVRILQENMQIIDGAIQEARSALAQDPHSGTLGELLRSAYQRKLDLLKQAARSSAAT